MALDENRRIRIGLPLDLLFDRDNNELSKMEELATRSDNTLAKIGEKLKGGLQLPTNEDPGTGNIVIRGRPGTGKSIFALQLAQKCCEFNYINYDITKKKYFTWFISLEETPNNIESKAKNFGWHEDIFRVRSLNNLGKIARPEDYGEILKDILNLRKEVGSCKCHINNSHIHKDSSEANGHKEDDKYDQFHKVGEYGDSRIYVSSLSPRHLTNISSEKYDVFEDRYSQIEHLLAGAEYLRGNKKYPELALVCIDSLNVFGDQLLTREQIYRLFELFKRYKVIGVFTLEEDEGNVVSPDSRLHGDMIEYLADVVVSLQYDEESDYFLRYFEIVKSRYQHQIYGRHPFKILKDMSSEQIYQNDICSKYLMSNRQGIVIYPSLHYIVYGTGEKKRDDGRYLSSNREKKAISVTPKFDLGFENSELLLPMFTKKTDIVLIEGLPGTFKQTISINYLIRGLAEKENVLLINLQDRTSCNPIIDDLRISKKVKDFFVHELAVSIARSKSRAKVTKEVIDDIIAVKKATNDILKGYVDIASNSSWKSDCPLGISKMKYSLRQLFKVGKESLFENYCPKNMLEELTEKTAEKPETKEISQILKRCKLFMEKNEKTEEYIVINKYFNMLKKSLVSKKNNMVDIHAFSGRLIELMLLYCWKKYKWEDITSESIIHDVEKQIQDMISKYNAGELNIGEYIKSCYFRRTVTGGTKKKVECYGYKHTYKDKVSYLTEMAFPSGYIQPEEFIHEVRELLLREEQQGRKIKRIVFSDIGLIGVSYPLLKQSRTAGDLFLTAFSHIVRNYGNLQLLMTGTTGQYEGADDMISRARALADAVLKCSFCEVFGNRYVVMEGEGLIVNKKETMIKENDQQGRNTNADYGFMDYGRYLPGVVMPDEYARQNIFSVDLKKLEGLVGFGTGKLHRPGVLFHAFSEGKNHDQYNSGIQDMLSYTFGVPTMATRSQEDQQSCHNTVDQENENKVIVERFNSKDSEVLHRSLGLFKDKPRRNTIISTVDDFFITSKGKNANLAENAFVPIGSIDKFLKKHAETLVDGIKNKLSEDNINSKYVWPYYSNVLLLAYRIKKDNGETFEKDIETSSYFRILKKDGIGEYSEVPNRSYSKYNQKCDENGHTFRQCKSWRAVYELAEKIKTCLGDIKDNGSGLSGKQVERPLFEYYHSISETLSCMLLDVMYSIRGSQGDNLHELFQEITYPEINKTVIDFQKLLQNSEETRTKRGVYKSFQEEGEYLSPHAAVYVCWYSHLRELIRMHPQLANKIKVCALPGGGFTGDWYLGVLKGSVSIELGKEILQILSDPKEQYERLLKGVGLPVLKSFQEKHVYRAWEYSNKVWLETIYNIHDNANKRTDKNNYFELRSKLAVKCRQLVLPYRDKKDEISPPKYISDLLTRLAGRLV